MKVWDKVVVKECKPDELYNEVMYSDRHWDYKGLETKVIEVSWRKNDKIKIECAPELLFGKDMLVPLERKSEETRAYFASTDFLPSLPKEIIGEMRKWHDKFDGKFTEKEVYREAFRDKLETILTIKLAWRN